MIESFATQISDILRRRFLLGVSLFVAIIITIGFALWMASADARQKINELATANSDSSQWFLAQIEVEYFVFNTAMMTAVDGDKQDLANVRRRFDVFYSRIATFEVSSVLAPIFEDGETHTHVAAIKEYLDDLIPAIDGSDQELRDKLPWAIEQYSRIRPHVREVTLSGVRVLSASSDQKRERVAGALFDIGTIAIALFAVLLAVCVMLFFSTWSIGQASNEIDATRSRLQAIVGTSLDAIIVADESGIIIDYNGAAEQVFGYSAREALGAQMNRLVIPPNFRKKHDEAMERFKRTGERRVIGRGLIRVDAMRKSGEIFPVEIAIDTARGNHGRLFIAYIRDISARVRSEEELVDARDKAVAGEKAKSDLLAVMSHEMRTHLNGVLGSMQLLDRTELSMDQRKYLDVMKTSGNLLLEHVNNVLDISRIDSGKTEVVSESFDLEKMMRDLVASMKIAAQERGNDLKFDLVGTAPLPERVISDPVKLRQILVNLIGNAIKFTRDGKIQVELEKDTLSQDYEFRVIDTGIGISPADQERVFDDFVTLDASYRRDVEGTGLGLGIVRRLVQLLGGEIGVESDTGEGSIFWFRVPMRSAPVGRATRPARANQSEPERTLKHQMRVLVVEDNEINRMVIREMLRSEGVSVTEAVDGVEGIEKAAAASFDLIFMDISMPRLDGVSATREIRMGPGPNAQKPIIALTAHAMPGDIERFRSAGMADVLTKPLSFTKLAEVLHTYNEEQRDDSAQEDHTIGFADILGEEMMRDVRVRAYKELRDGLPGLNGFLARGRTDAGLVQAAHKLAGTAAVSGFRDIHALLSGIEDSAKAGEHPETIRAKLDQVADCLDTLANEFDG